MKKTYVSLLVRFFFGGSPLQQHHTMDGTAAVKMQIVFVQPWSPTRGDSIVPTYDIYIYIFTPTNMDQYSNMNT